MADNPLEGKVALITGGAHRIGAAVARMLHAHGMKLVIHYHTSERAAHALQEELHKNRPESVMLVRGDLNSGERQARNLVFETVESFDRLDVLINNASRFYPTPVGESTESQWDDIVGTNLKAPYFLAQAAVPHLKKTGGCVVNIADIYGDRPLIGYLIYSVAKAGVIMLTKALARELGPEIRVNAIAPGSTATRRWTELVGITARERGTSAADAEKYLLREVPLGKVITPEAIADLAVFLASARASLISGTAINVDGGRTRGI